ncbi:MAG: winged helix-turn-helix domain-containing protein [Myxococcota bacterium]
MVFKSPEDGYPRRNPDPGVPMTPRQFADCTVDLASGRVVRSDGDVELTPLELSLLRYLVQHEGQTVPRPQLQQAVWGTAAPGRRMVDFTLRRLRMKVERDPKAPDHLKTVRGLGIRFDGLPGERGFAPPEALHDRNIRLHDRSIDFDVGCVLGPEGRVTLTPMEVAILRYLDDRRGRVVTRERLLQDVWGYAAGVRTSTLHTTLHRLRAKIESDPMNPRHLLTVRGAGVRFEPEAAPAPLALDAFVGRSVEQSALEKRFKGGRWVTLTGMGGMGKTRLALEFVRQLTERRGPPVWWVDAANLKDAEGLLRGVRQALGVRAEPAMSPEAQTVQIARALRRVGPGWLVLDTIERIAGPVARHVERWLAAAGELRVLATSREATLGRGEQRIVVGPLSTDDGVRLLIERMSQAGWSQKALEDLEGLDQLVEALEGIPLALELAVPKVRTLGLDELLRLLPERLDLLGPRPATPRASTLRGMVDWSWSMLTNEERTTLSQCTVFRGPFSARIASEVLTVDDSLVQLSSLVSKSLLNTRLDRYGQAVFTLLDTVRFFAAERLEDDDVLRARHLKAYRQRVREWRTQAQTSRMS